MANNIQLYSGFLFDFDKVEENPLIIADIAHSLANQCRWSGHVIKFYSVAEHSCYCADKALEIHKSHWLAWEALLHDGAEAYMVDLPRPLKKKLSGYTELLEEVETYFNKSWGLPEKMSPEVKEIDDRMLVTEYRNIIDVHNQINHPDFQHFYVEPYENITFNFWRPEQAEWEFRRRFIDIAEKVGFVLEKSMT